MNLLKKMGFTKKENALRFPKEESYPSPPMEYRLHQLTPNYILHVSIFITLCECFLGVQPNWALWKRIFCLHRNGSHGVAYNIGGVVICVRSDVEYFDVKFPDSVQGWRKRWLYVHEESSDSVDGDEDENTLIDATARTSTSCTLVVSEAQPDGDETSPPQQNTEHPTPAVSPQAPSPKRARVEPAKEPILFSGSSTTPSLDDPLMKEFIRLGTQFVGYRDYTKKLEENLADSNKRADALATKLEQSEKARKKAEADAPAVEDLRKRLHDAETSLSENITQQSAREKEILTRLESQSRRFIKRTDQEYELENPKGDQLLDALSLLEIHGDEARDGLSEAKIGLSRLFPYFFKKKEAQDAIAEKENAVSEAAAASARENFMLQLMTDSSLDMTGSFLDTAAEDERVEARSTALLRLALEHGSNFWGTPERTRQIVRFQDRALQVREFLNFCTRTLSLVYGTMFPRNKMPETLPDLMEKFRDAPRIHGFVRAQLSAGAGFAMMMIKICYPKFDMSQIVTKCLAKMAKRKRNVGKIDDIVTPVAEDMMDELLRMDAEFFVKGSYAEHSTRPANNERMTIDDILGST
ncbi:hypothetical protein QYE76_051346 [Lolium multiflorum]|uniref:Transposase (putative) gypsy type domain-containing protein n=1 Tax=Lolium multiflorum TaxID=4521 RepID=A0AAD8WHT9_LOLMU|nr:hypothetical protein QYE76_051346 [Lolium multiflorum]